MIRNEATEVDSKAITNPDTMGEREESEKGMLQLEGEEIRQPARSPWAIEEQLDRMCAIYVNYPKTTFGVCCGIQLSLVIVTMFLHGINYNILPYDFSPVPLNLESDPTKLHADAFNFVTLDPRIDLHPRMMMQQNESSMRHSPVEIVFGSPQGSSILTRASLLAIQSTEQHLYRDPHYQATCQRDAQSGNCTRPLSLLRLFDGSFLGVHASLHDPHFEDIDRVITTAWNASATRALLAFSLDKEATVKGGSPAASFVRSIFFHGLPLHGYKSSEDRKAEQEALVDASVRVTFGDYLEQLYRDGVGGMKVYYLSLPLFFAAIEQQVKYDLMLAAGSLAFIYCYIWFQTASFWITSWAVFAILTNFFGANLLYRILFDFQYIGTFHVLSVFIILGIGADDIFVFYNTWKLMELRNFPDLAAHLRETFRSAAGAMFVTSLTTMAAFLASAASPLLGVSSFGVFSGILVMVNYFSVCVFLPIVVVTHHLFWKAEPCCSVARRALCIRHGSGEPAPAKFPPTLTHMFKAIVDWFQGPFADAILHRTGRWFILAFFVALCVVFMSYAAKLKPDEEQVQVWPKGTNWYEMRKIRVNHFEESGSGTNVIRVYMVWGLLPQDRGACHFTDSKCRGETRFDDRFNMNNLQCQTGMLGICRKLLNLPQPMADALKIRRSIETGGLEVSCFLDSIDTFLREDTVRGIRSKKYPNTTRLQVPVDGAMARAIMRGNPGLFNASLLTDAYSNYFEVALSYWLSNGGRPGYDSVKYGDWLGGSMDASAAGRVDRLALAQGNLYGNKLRYAAIVVNLTKTGATLRHNEGVILLQRWEDFINTERASLPEECRQAFQCTPEWNNWHWLRVQEVLLHGAIQGIIIGLGVALPVLVFTTLNWIVGLLATVTIGLITLSVVGLIPMMGWRLGVMESLNLTLVVGLAVDYAVHLADGYVRSKRRHREDRVRDMLGHVAVSIVAGASTTLGASAFMLGAKILFFLQFGIFMFCTIGFSLLFALGFFTVVIGIIGPEGNRGVIKLNICCPRKANGDSLNLQLQPHTNAASIATYDSAILLTPTISRPIDVLSRH